MAQMTNACAFCAWQLVQFLGSHLNENTKFLLAYELVQQMDINRSGALDREEWKAYMRDSYMRNPDLAIRFVDSVRKKLAKARAHEA